MVVVEYAFQRVDAIFESLRQRPQVFEHLFVVSRYLPGLLPPCYEVQHDDQWQPDCQEQQDRGASEFSDHDPSL